MVNVIIDKTLIMEIIMNSRNMLMVITESKKEERIMISLTPVIDHRRVYIYK